jgi:RNA polymerase sigma factor (sigma-70 family)
MRSPKSPARPGRRYMVAMVLGTALSALAPAAVQAATEASVSTKAVSDLGRYCTACWRNARLPVSCWGDCTQEVFCRLLERVPAHAWDSVLSKEGDEHREFLRAIDTVKKRVQRARKYSGSLDGVADQNSAVTDRRAEEREAVDQAARALLTPRQQQILQLSFEGWGVHEISQELTLPPERVSDEKYKAIRKLRSHLSERADEVG